MKPKGYTPKPGSKAAAAVQALLDGPINQANMCKTLNTNSGNLFNLLSTPIQHGLIVRVKDETGMIHYALPDMPLDRRFVLLNDQRPTLAPHDPADPFGLAARRSSKPAAADRKEQSESADTPVAAATPLPVKVLSLPTEAKEAPLKTEPKPATSRGITVNVPNDSPVADMTKPEISLSASDVLLCAMRAMSAGGVSTAEGVRTKFGYEVMNLVLVKGRNLEIAA